MAEGLRFANEIAVDPRLLRYEPFQDRGQVSRFDCGEAPLNDSLNTDEVEEYEREKLGSTWLVFYQGELVAYYAIGTDSLRRGYVDAKKLSGSYFKRGGSNPSPR